MSDARLGELREHGERDLGDERPRVYDQRDRHDYDPRDELLRDLDLPRGEESELVVDRDHVYDLNGDDSRTLAAVGTFRVVPEHDLDADRDTLNHLRGEGRSTTSLSSIPPVAPGSSLQRLCGRDARRLARRQCGR